MGMDEGVDAVVNSGIVCLRNLAANLKRDINFNALLTSELQKELGEDPVQGLMKLATGLQLQPELHNDAVTLTETYSGPALVRLLNGNWVLAVNLTQIQQEKLTIFDPTVKGDNPIVVPKEQFVERIDGPVMIFRMLQTVDNRKHSALFGLTAIGRHHNVPLDIRRLLHDYAVGEEDVSARELIEIAGDHNLKAKRVKLSWQDLERLGEAFPALGFKKDGTCNVICGMRHSEENGDQVVVVDPAFQADHPGQQFQFLSREEFENISAGDGLLVKRIYKLADEEQPFGLRWFIPEFLKLKGLFGQIAVAVLMINIIALITPLFFQIVVDKVLVNNTYRR